jgi:hypothetical protein
MPDPTPREALARVLPHAAPRVLELVATIKAAARAGRTCPANHELAAALGYQSVSSPATLLSQAEAAGLVVVERGHMARVVAAADGSWRTAAPRASAAEDTAFLERAAALSGGSVGAGGSRDNPRRPMVPAPRAATSAPALPATRGRAFEQHWPRLEAMLRAAAEAGRRCPSGEALAAAMGFARSSAPNALLREAEALGLVVVERGACNRVVAAADGSWRTAGEARGQCTRNGGRKAAPAAPPEPALPEPPEPRNWQSSAAGWAAAMARTRAQRAAMPVQAPPPLATPAPARLSPGCQWPMWEAETPRWAPLYGRCCGAARPPGRPYCAEHAARAFVCRAVPAQQVAA